MNGLQKGLIIAVIVATITLGAGVLWFSQPEPNVTLNGAGATFPFPLIDKWTKEYNRIKPNVQVNYQAIGSGGGIRQHTAKTVYFGASDAPLTETQFANASGTLHIPFTIGGVAITYNVPGVPKGLKFNGTVIADIFLAKITKWNDKALVELNPDVNLPDRDIIVVHRSDGSGTTFVFTNYLSDVSREWATTVGKSTSVNWPTGLGGKGNEGVAGLIAQNPYSVGYNEFIYAKLNNLTYGYVRNAAGVFVEPSLESFSAAAGAAALTLPAGNESWSKVSIIDSIVNNTQATEAYPITSFAYFLVYKELNVLPGMNMQIAKALVGFLWWTIHDGQNFAAALVYVPLPQEVRAHNEATIRMITFNGQRVLSG